MPSRLALSWIDSSSFPLQVAEPCSERSRLLAHKTEITTNATFCNATHRNATERHRQAIFLWIPSSGAKG